MRRKVYTEEETAEIDRNWKGFLRKWKARRGYNASLILNMDEIPLYMDMCRGWTLDFQRGKSVEANFTKQ